MKSFFFILFFFASGMTLAQEKCPLPETFEAVDPFVLNINDVDIPKGWQLLNIWAIWCAPCRKELPLLDQYEANKPPITIMAINLGDEQKQVESLFQALNIEHLNKIISMDNKLLSKLHAVGLPFSALIFDGEVVATKAGILEETQSITRFINCKQGENL